MGYDRHAGHVEIFGRGPGGRAAKSSLDGKRKEGGRGNAFKAYNPVQSGTYGSGRSKRPDQAHQLYVKGDHRTDGPGCQYVAGGGAKEESLGQRDARLRKSEKTTWFGNHPQHPGWRRAVMRAPNRKVVSG